MEIGFPGGSDGKESARSRGDLALIPTIDDCFLIVGKECEIGKG